MRMFRPGDTDSPEAKRFLVWLQEHGFGQIWQAYDPVIRRRYGHDLSEIQRVMEDPDFGIAAFAAPVPACPSTFLGAQCERPADHRGAHKAQDTCGYVTSWTDASADGAAS